DDCDTWPVAWSTEPGVPMPTAARSAAVAFAAANDSLMVAMISWSTSSAVVRGVRCRDCPTIVGPSTTTVWIFVPPRSTPAVSLGMSTCCQDGHTHQWWAARYGPRAKAPPTNQEASHGHRAFGHRRALRSHRRPGEEEAVPGAVSAGQERSPRHADHRRRQV